MSTSGALSTITFNTASNVQYPIQRVSLNLQSCQLITVATGPIYQNTLLKHFSIPSFSSTCYKVAVAIITTTSTSTTVKTTAMTTPTTSTSTVTTQTTTPTSTQTFATTPTTVSITSTLFTSNISQTSSLSSTSLVTPTTQTMTTLTNTTNFISSTLSTSTTTTTTYSTTTSFNLTPVQTFACPNVDRLCNLNWSYLASNDSVRMSLTVQAPNHSVWYAIGFNEEPEMVSFNIILMHNGVVKIY